MPPRLPTAQASPHAESIIVEALFNATRAFRHRLHPELGRAGLTSPMFWTLHQLVTDGPRNVGQLADACVVTPANVSSAVEALEDAGLVVRHAAPTDRRVVVLTATPRGRAAHRAVWARLGSILVTSLSGLPTSDLQATARVLGRLAGSPVTAPMEAR